MNILIVASPRLRLRLLDSRNFLGVPGAAMGNLLFKQRQRGSRKLVEGRPYLAGRRAGYPLETSH